MDDDVQAVLGGLVVQWLGRRTCDQQIAALHCWVSTWMGDRVCAGKPARYVTCNPAFYPSVVGKWLTEYLTECSNEYTVSTDVERCQ